MEDTTEGEINNEVNLQQDIKNLKKKRKIAIILILIIILFGATAAVLLIASSDRYTDDRTNWADALNSCPDHIEDRSDDYDYQSVTVNIHDTDMEPIPKAAILLDGEC